MLQMACSGSELDPRQAAQHHHSAGIALMGEEVLQMDLPSSITAHSTCLVVYTSRETSAHRFARLIGDCFNLRSLDIAVGGVSEPASCIPYTLPRLSHLHFFAQRAVSAKQLSGLIQLVPHVEFISCLPTTFPGDDLGPLEQRLIQHLYLDLTQDSTVLLRSLIVHGWNVRSIFLSVTPSILEVLSQANFGAGALFATRKLAIHINSRCVDETRALCALLAACDLRCLAIRAPAAKAAALLEVAPLNGLRALSLNFMNVGAVDAVRDAARVLARSMPRALRAIRVSRMTVYARDLDALQVLCQTRRIAYHHIDGKWWGI